MNIPKFSSFQLQQDGGNALNLGICQSEGSLELTLETISGASDVDEEDNRVP